MKMKHIILLTVIFAGIFSLSNQLKSRQLFDLVDKELSNNKHNNVNQEAKSIFFMNEDDKKDDLSFTQKKENTKDSSKSLFDDSDDVKPIKSLFGNEETEKKQNNIFSNNKKLEKSLFDDVSDSKPIPIVNNNNNKNNKKNVSLFDIDEEQIKPEVKLNEDIHPKINIKENQIKKNLYTNNVNNKVKLPAKNSHQKLNTKNKNVNQSQHKNNEILHHQTTPKIITPISEDTLNRNRSEIEKLKSKIVNLVNINKQLLKEMDKKRKVKKQSLEVSDDLINLIEKSSTPIEKYEEKIDKTETKNNEKINKKEKELKSVYQDVRKNMDDLIGKIETTKKSLNEISSDESFISGENKKNYSTDLLTVLNNAEVEDVTSVKNVNTESLDIGNIRIDLEKISLANPETDIVVGSEILSIKELIENLEIIEKLNARCGENFENCIQYNDQLFQYDIERQNEIIEKLKTLRRETKEIIQNRK